MGCETNTDSLFKTNKNINIIFQCLAMLPDTKEKTFMSKIALWGWMKINFQYLNFLSCRKVFTKKGIVVVSKMSRNRITVLS